MKVYLHIYAKHAKLNKVFLKTLLSIYFLFKDIKVIKFCSLIRYFKFNMSNKKQFK